ncbi:MAG TPA: FAD-dependent oxidoreductase, partial [Actinomycetota bacterium]|nr:FAD-dependent oxidoreductase [Actinomycetota bacterium]
MTTRRVVIVGGGIAGLAVAYGLQGRARTTVLEAAPRLGGKVFTSRLEGIPIEFGPDSLLARNDAPVRLLRELGLADAIREPANFGAWIV